MHDECVKRESEIAAAWARAEKEVDSLKLQVGVLLADLHRIACAECTVHDEKCEREQGTAYCACDARVAGNASRGYECQYAQKPKCGRLRPEYAWCALDAGHDGPHDSKWIADSAEKRMPPVQITEGDIKNLEQTSKGIPDPVTRGDEDL